MGFSVYPHLINQIFPVGCAVLCGLLARFLMGMGLTYKDAVRRFMSGNRPSRLRDRNVRSLEEKRKDAGIVGHYLLLASIYVSARYFLKICVPNSPENLPYYAVIDLPFINKIYIPQSTLISFDAFFLILMFILWCYFIHRIATLRANSTRERFFRGSKIPLMKSLKVKQVINSLGLFSLSFAFLNIFLGR